MNLNFKLRDKSRAAVARSNLSRLIGTFRVLSRLQIARIFATRNVAVFTAALLRHGVLDAHRAGSRYRFIESRKSRTVVKRGPVLACRPGGTRDERIHVACHVRRRDENADAETGIAGPGLAAANDCYVDIGFHPLCARSSRTTRAAVLSESSKHDILDATVANPSMLSRQKLLSFYGT